MAFIFRTVATCICLAVSSARADIIEFHFTGQFTVLDWYGDYAFPQSPIESTFIFNTDNGIGSADLIIAPFMFDSTLNIVLGNISMRTIENTNLILGNMLGTVLPGADGTGGETDIPISLIWDATGLFNAINYGLQAGDIISGSSFIRDGSTIYDVGSALPATDIVRDKSYYFDQGPAPLATTTFNPEWLCAIGPDCVGVPLSGGPNYTDDGVPGAPILGGSAAGYNVNIDIGSGNSLTVLSVATVPVPAAFWLFCSGLAGLMFVTKRKMA